MNLKSILMFFNRGRYEARVDNYDVDATIIEKNNSEINWTGYQAEEGKSLKVEGIYLKILKKYIKSVIVINVQIIYTFLYI